MCGLGGLPLGMCGLACGLALVGFAPPILDGVL
jgi:hypothetical protein